MDGFDRRAVVGAIFDWPDQVVLCTIRRSEELLKFRGGIGSIETVADRADFEVTDFGESGFDESGIGDRVEPDFAIRIVKKPCRQTTLHSRVRFRDSNV